MDIYRPLIIELEERIFYVCSSENKKTSKPLNQTKDSLSYLTDMQGKDLTILMTPFSNFKNVEIDIPDTKYYKSIINFLKNGNTPAIILEDYNLDRLILETIKGELKAPRIFIQTGTEIREEFGYYKDSNKLSTLVDTIMPRRIYVGGAFLQETEKELKEWDLERFPWEHSADSGCFVGPIYLLFRDKYPTKIAKDLILKG
jgi:hypothetical protein